MSATLRAGGGTHRPCINCSNTSVPLQQGTSDLGLLRCIASCYSPDVLEKMSESLGGVYGVSRQIAEKALFDPFALLAAAKSTLGALLEPLFGQFLEEVFCELRLY